MRRDTAQQFTTQSGGNSRLIFGQQTNYYTRVPMIDAGDSWAQAKTLGNLYKYIPIVTSISLADQTETINIEFLKGSSSANKYQQGPFRYGGGFSIGASTEGTQLFFQGISNDKEPTAVRPPNGPSTYPDLNATATWTPRYGAFGGTDMALGNMEVTGGADPTVTNDNWTNLTTELPASADDAPQRLEVILGKDGGASGSGETGTVEIEGYDYHGQRIRERIRISKTVNGEASLARTRSYFGSPPSGRNTRFRVVEALSLSSPAVSGNDDQCLGIRSRDERIEVTFDLQDADFLGGWTIEAQKGSGVVHTYIGVYPVSMSVSLARTSALTYDIECLAWDMFPYENIAGVDTTEGDFTVPGVDLEDGTPGIRFQIDDNLPELPLGTAPDELEVTALPSGVTAPTPPTKLSGSGAQNASGSTSTWRLPLTTTNDVTAAQVGTITLAVSGHTIVAGSRRNGGSKIPYSDTNLTSSAAAPTRGADFQLSPQELYTGWQCQLRLGRPDRPDDDATVIPLLDTTFTVNQTIEQAELIIGERNPGPLFRSGLREVTLSGTMLLTRDRNWIQEFRDNAVFDKGELILANIVTGGFPYTTIFKFGHGQLTTAPDATVDGLGLVSVPFNMMFFDEDFGDPTDFSIVVTYHQEDWYRSAGQDSYPPTQLQYNGGLRHYTAVPPFTYETI